MGKAVVVVLSLFLTYMALGTDFRVSGEGMLSYTMRIFGLGE